MTDFAQRLLEHDDLGRMVAHHRRIEGREAELAEPSRPLHPLLAEALRQRGITSLYRHQAEAIDRARAGDDLVLVTPTASGKTLCFAAAVLESMLEAPRAKALFLYPTKALARDQIAGLRDLAGGLRALRPTSFEIYDGDTPSTRRRKIKADLPDVLITNPDMLHLGILGHHADWRELLANLRWVVLDELHVYRGIFGAHVHHILARLLRLCEHYGARPQFITASATIGNAAEFAGTLVGRPFHAIEASGAPQSRRDVVFLNPSGVSPYTAAVRVVAEALRAGQRTIAFTKARRITELLHSWLLRQEPQWEDRVAPYRAGYLPEERRRIEARLFSGELLAVLSTSALELGIDVGGLDLCVLVGYPGSLVSSWQRIGRVGRRGRHGTIVLVAMPDALDQYVVHHPELFFGGTFERAVLDPWNPFVAGQHMVCAASEQPIQRGELERRGPAASRLADDLVQQGRLVLDAPGSRWFSFRRRPQREVSPRSAGPAYTIAMADSGRVLGTIDGGRVYYECHPGAIYLHGGRSYLIRELDRERRRVTAEPVSVDYYTVVMGDKETEILERLDTRLLGPHPVGLGRFKVTVRIREYQKKRLFDGETIATHPLEVPPLVFETVGFWIELPPDLPAKFSERELHFMGGIHATEHAAIGLFPLLAIADRGDVGGISYTGHPQIGGPAIFVYDGVPGGAGLAEQGYRSLETHLGRTLELVGGCPCDDGCPSCIQSPRCGNGNKPLDKSAALEVLGLLTGGIALDSYGVAAAEPSWNVPLAPFPVSDRESEGMRSRHGIRRAGNLEPIATSPQPTADPIDGRRLFFDLETQRGATEVGGWGNTARMGLAVAVVFDAERQSYRTYYEADVERLLLDLVTAERVVGFNIDRFDLQVLSGYTDWDLGRIRTLDMLGELHQRLGFRISLEHLSEANLGEGKAGSGLQSLRWWKEGRLDLIEQYCRKDVEMTRRLFELGHDQGYLLYRDHEERKVRVPVQW